MKERLLKMITSEGLNPSLLADEIGVQRSGISHILSGRNNPSFDFMQKLLTRFPKLNAEWLILGEGAMYKSTVAEEALPELFPPVEKMPLSHSIPERPQDLTSGEDDEKKISVPETEKIPPEISKKTIEKMIVLYSDKTFATYFPE